MPCLRKEDHLYGSQSVHVMPQTLDWTPGDRYRTRDGSIMRISCIGADVIDCECEDETEGVHIFDMNGNSQCCAHGDLVSRITGSVHG